MATDAPHQKDQPTAAPRAASAWRRLLAWVQAFEQAMDTSCDDIQDRRILALEREVSLLRAQHDAGRR